MRRLISDIKEEQHPRFDDDFWDWKRRGFSWRSWKKLKVLLGYFWRNRRSFWRSISSLLLIIYSIHRDVIQFQSLFFRVLQLRLHHHHHLLLSLSSSSLQNDIRKGCKFFLILYLIDFESCKFANFDFTIFLIGVLLAYSSRGKLRDTSRG